MKWRLMGCLALAGVLFAVNSPGVIARSSSHFLGELVPGENYDRLLEDSRRRQLRYALQQEKHAQIESVSGIPPASSGGFGKNTYQLTRPLRVGVQKLLMTGLDQSLVNNTRVKLQETFGKASVEFIYFSPHELDEAIRKQTIDFSITSADVFTYHEAFQRLKSMASLLNIEARDSGNTAGALFFTAAKNTDINSIEDLRGKVIAGRTQGGFQSDLIPRREVLIRDRRNKNLLNNMHFLGDDPTGVVYAVLKGKASAGILPVCELERLVAQGLKTDAIKYLDADTGGLLSCAYSTQLYPGIYFSQLPDTQEALVKVTTAALYTMLDAGSGKIWTIAASSRPVHDLFFDLKSGPYQYLREWTLQRFIDEQSHILAGIFLFCVLSLAWILSLSILVRRRTRLLKAALDERDAIEELATVSRNRIAHLEQTGIVGQMSTMIAHELKQPLGAITNFSNGLLRRIKRGTMDPKVLEETLREIVDQGNRASEIVNRVRAYAKNESPGLAMADMAVAIDRAIEEFIRSRRTDAKIVRNIPPNLWADIDPWEIELAVLNLLKNSADALKETMIPIIEISVESEGRFWCIHVKDNGALITQAEVDAFMEPLVTSKPTGLGLGLTIVASIAERHHGRIAGTANRERGVTITLYIPHAAMPEACAI